MRDVAAEDGVLLAESELIGLAPLAAFLAVADRADAPSEDPVERRLAAAAAFLRLRTSRRCRHSNCDSRTRAHRPTAMSGGPFRLIHGGRSEEPTPGLLIVGASEVVTLAGGVRMGARQGDVERLSAADFGGPMERMLRSSPAGRVASSRSDHGRPSRPRSRQRATSSDGSPASTPVAARSRRA